MNQFEITLFAVPGSGRKGIAYDWQSLMAAEGVVAIETELAELVLETAE